MLHTLGELPPFLLNEVGLGNLAYCGSYDFVTKFVCPKTEAERSFNRKFHGL